jgi:hypothetical protein
VCDGGTNFWELDINDVTKLSLRMIGNTNSDDIALNLGPLWSHYDILHEYRKKIIASDE